MLMYKEKIDGLILNYFIQEGYKEAAIKFAKETNTELSQGTRKQLDPTSISFLESLNKDDILTSVNKFKFDDKSESINVHNKKSKISRGYSTINDRKLIKYLILKGEITEAVTKISEKFPLVLDSNNLLHFKLLRLSLIEMIRNHKLNSYEETTDTEKTFLNDILVFVRENLINKVTKSFKLLKELEITMSLLCFNFDPHVNSIEDQKDLPEELRSLFDLSLRTQCYRLVNRAILNLDPESEVSNNNQLKDYEDAQIYYDKLTLSKSRHNYNFNGDMSVLDQIDTTISHDLMPDIESSVNLDGDSDDDEGNEVEMQDEAEEEEASKFQDLALESKLEKVVKLWTITEQRLVDLQRIKSKRYNLNTEHLT